MPPTRIQSEPRPPPLRPEAIAFVFLARDAGSACITGTIMPVMGGETNRLLSPHRGARPPTRSPLPET